MNPSFSKYFVPCFRSCFHSAFITYHRYHPCCHSIGPGAAPSTSASSKPDAALMARQVRRLKRKEAPASRFKWQRHDVMFSARVFLFCATHAREVTAFQWRVVLCVISATEIVGLWLKLRRDAVGGWREELGATLQFFCILKNLRSSVTQSLTAKHGLGGVNQSW